MVFFLFSAVNAVSDTDTPEHSQTLALIAPDACHFSGSFHQSKHVKSLPVLLESTGDFLFSCQYGLIWRTKQPVLESLIFTKENTHFLMTENEDATVLEGAEYDFMAKLLLGLMSGDTHYIEKAFEVEVQHTADSKKAIEATETTNKQTIQLTPKSKFIKKAIHSVLLSKELTNASLRITITDKNQQATKIETKQVKTFSDEKGFGKYCSTQFADSETCQLLMGKGHFPISEVY